MLQWTGRISTQAGHSRGIKGYQWSCHLQSQRWLRDSQLSPNAYEFSPAIPRNPLPRGPATLSHYLAVKRGFRKGPAVTPLCNRLSMWDASRTTTRARDGPLNHRLQVQVPVRLHEFTDAFGEFHTNFIDKHSGVNDINTSCILCFRSLFSTGHLYANSRPLPNFYK
jgi:hypothetical protein